MPNYDASFPLNTDYIFFCKKTDLQKGMPMYIDF